MTKRILIDGVHPEETRVAIVNGDRIEAFDYESPDHKPLRGNIYLAKVMRVEPSLQAAFVDFGGNRHGFLAFSEIHPDYYQIPVADRQALVEEAAEEAKRLAEEEEEAAEDEFADSEGEDASILADDQDDEGDEVPAPRRRRGRGRSSSKSAKHEARQADQDDGADGEAANDGDTASSGAEDGGANPAEEPSEAPQVEAAPEEPEAKPRRARRSLFGRPLRRRDRSREDFVESDPVAVESAPDAAGDSPESADQNEASSEPDDQKSGQPASTDPQDTDQPSILGDDQQNSDDAETNDDEPSNEAESGDAAPSGPRQRGRQNNRSRSGGNRRGGSQSGNDRNGRSKRGVRTDGLGRAQSFTNRYRIQEVIKRGQILLIQVVKEERGNKGAALTTYLSLAGRYAVLMPNTARGGGISRKIAKPQDRRRLKEVASELEVPKGMGVILRTAGATRTKRDIHRDFEYLALLWDRVRERTLGSVAPSLVHEEGSLIKRAIRDMFDKEYDEILVQGNSAYAEAQDFMQLLVPSQSNSIKRYKGKVPIFSRYDIEKQLDGMLSPIVKLRSGGYIVINQTEALVSIDINSGKATREHNIEDMALSTNLEAAVEICRQLRLRDLAGLIVIDFIDMEERRNNRAVENKVKDALRDDRARTQVRQISSFGLMEMSRQRQRTGLLEGSSVPCPTCNGAGQVRSPSSLSLQVLRAVGGYLDTHQARDVTVRTKADIAMQILNHFRVSLAQLEDRHGITIHMAIDDTLQGEKVFHIDRGDKATPPRRTNAYLREDEVEQDMLALEAPEIDANDGGETSEGEASGQAKSENGKSRRRRNRRGRGRGESASSAAENQESGQSSEEAQSAASDVSADQAEGGAEAGAAEKQPKQRRSRRSSAKSAETSAPEAEASPALEGKETDAEDKPKPKRTRTRKKADSAEPGEAVTAAEEPKAEEKPKRSRAKKVPAAKDAKGETKPEAQEAEAEETPKKKPARSRKAKAGEEAAPAKKETSPRAKKSKETKTSSKDGEASQAKTADAPAANSTKTKAAAASETAAPPEPAAPKKRGWWQRNVLKSDE